MNWKRRNKNILRRISVVRINVGDKCQKQDLRKCFPRIKFMTSLKLICSYWLDIFLCCRNIFKSPSIFEFPFRSIMLYSVHVKTIWKASVHSLIGKSISPQSDCTPNIVIEEREQICVLRTNAKWNSFTNRSLIDTRLLD